MIFTARDLALLFSSTLTFATPLIIASMGSIMSETSGVVNIGIEGKMTIGAFVTAAVGTTVLNPWIALLSGMIAGALFGLLHALACITFKADQTVSGIAINLLAPGCAIFFSRALFDGASQTPNIVLQYKIPRIFVDSFREGGERTTASLALGNYISVYLCFVIAFAVWFFLFRTRFGLRIRSVGEHPRAAATLGIKVRSLRYFAVIMSGALAALGGAVIPLSTVSQFFPAIIAGQGFIALAAVIFGKFKPLNTVFACLLFGFCQSLALLLGNPRFGLNVSPHLLNIIPYAITLIVLLFMGRSYAPAASGKVYDPASA